MEVVSSLDTLFTGFGVHLWSKYEYTSAHILSYWFQCWFSFIWPVGNPLHMTVNSPRRPTQTSPQQGCLWWTRIGGNSPQAKCPASSLSLSDLSHWYMNIAPVLRLRHFHWIFNLVTECSGQWLACSQSLDDLWYCNVLLFFFFLLFFGRLPQPHRGHWHWFSWRRDKSWNGRILLRGKCKCMNTTSLLTT